MGKFSNSGKLNKDLGHLDMSLLPPVPGVMSVMLLKV